MQTIRSTFILVFVAMAASLSMLSGALAHAALVGSDPADGAVLPAAPPQIVLEFTEPVTPLVVTLIAPDGQSSALDAATASNAAVTIPLPALQSRGTYLISWRVSSADGHPVGGALVFSIGEPGSRPVAATEGDTALMAAIWLTRTALYAALFLGVGAAVFGLLVAPLPRPLTRLPRVMAVAGLVLAPSRSACRASTRWGSVSAASRPRRSGARRSAPAMPPPWPSPPARLLPRWSRLCCRPDEAAALSSVLPGWARRWRRC